MSARGLQLGGLVGTVLFHAALAVVALSHLGGGSPADASARFENAVTIEASLAFKEVKPQSRQPQKQRKQVAPPPEPEKIASEPLVPAEPEPEDKPRPKPKPRSANVNIEETLKEHHISEEDLSSTGVDEVPKEGSADGSKWGTEVDAKGHPYAAELKGRIYSVWTLPTLETGTGEVHGCVKLDESGKIVDRHVKKKSGNANLDRSVELALKQAPDMDKPVPDELRSLITVKGICFRFTP